MAKLTKIIKHQKFNNAKWGEENRMLVTVEYEPETGDYEILSIIAESNKILRDGNVITHFNLCSVVDLTGLMNSVEVSGINWALEYYRQKQEVA
jgi:hypothetical protein